MERHGWVLLFHDCIVAQLQKLYTVAQRAEREDPHHFERNNNVKLFRALNQLILETVPSDPARTEYRQGNTLGAPHRHWRRAKTGRRFRLGQLKACWKEATRQTRGTSSLLKANLIGRAVAADSLRGFSGRNLYRFKAGRQ